MKSWLQRTFINLLVHHLFNAVTEKDILQMKGRDIYFQGQKISKENALKLKADAKIWGDSMLWQVLSIEAKSAANKRMFDRAVTIEDIIAGKMMLYSIDIIEQKLAQLTRL
jgi:hypothetical protein